MQYNKLMNKIFFLVILLLFSAQGFAGSCPDGSDPVRSISADGTYFVFNCAGSSNNDTSSSTNTSSIASKSSSNLSSQEIDRFGGYSEIPEDANPNDETLKFYLYRYLYSYNIYPYCGDSKEFFCEDSPPNFTHPVESSINPYQFHSDLREDKYIQKQMQDTALLSYLLFEDGKIVIDEITPEDRFGDMFRDSSKFHSQSVAKTLISYVSGHAICKGYIDSVDSRLDDWPVLENTLYHNQKLIDILNMAAGTQEYFIGANKFKNSSRYVTNPTVKDAMENELKGSKKSSSIYNYNNMNPNVVGSYLIYKLGDENFQELLDDVFKNKARIEGDVFFLKNKSAKKDDLSMWSQFYATRYDYLRIANAMLDDWQNDTCAGKYLKTIYERRINKGNVGYKPGTRVSMPGGYAGFFHTNYKGMENRPVMSMDGYGGQTITIDFERGRIIATQAIHDNMMFPQPGSYDWKKIVYERIKNGKPASNIKSPPEPVIDSQQIIKEKNTAIETEKKAKEYWDNYYDAMDEKSQRVLYGGSEDGSILFREDFENLDQRKLRVDDRDNQWYVKKGNNGNSMYCNKKVTSEDYAGFNLGRKNWRDYSISYRMKFTAGKGGELETHIRKKGNRQGEYRSVISNLTGTTELKFVKNAEKINQRIASGSSSKIEDKWAAIKLIALGNNIKYLVNNKVVASTKDDRVEKGAVMFAVTSKSELCIDDIVIKKEIAKDESKTIETKTVETKKIKASDSDPAVSKVIEVTHGDKLIVEIAEPHELAGSNIMVSLKDIDAPDATRSCPKQLELGLKVKDYVTQKLENAISIKLTNFRKTNTKIIAQVIVDGVDLGEELVSKGYASEEYGYWKPYFCSALSATNQADQYVDTDERKAIFWYERSIILDPDGSKNQESHFLLSKMYFNLGDTNKSLDSLKKSASLGWIAAMEQLGSDYLNGNGVKKNPNQGKNWLKKAFDKGSQIAEDIYCGSLPESKQKTCKF